MANWGICLIYSLKKRVSSSLIYILGNIENKEAGVVLLSLISGLSLFPLHLQQTEIAVRIYHIK